MPIRGLSDRAAAFPEIGRIRKGAPKTEEGYVGKDLAYFRIELDEAEKEAAATLRDSYPENPAELNILLPFNSVDENFDAWREAYVAGGMVHRCDGERVWYEINPTTGERVVIAGDPIKRCDGKKNCKPVGRLKVLIPELQRLAYLTVLTGSIHDIMNISRQLEAILQINGKLAGVPLKLRRRPMAISTPSGSDGKRARRTKSLLSIEADPEWVKYKLQSMRIAALPDYETADDLPALEAPEEPDDDWTMDDVVEGETVPQTEESLIEEKPPLPSEPDPFVQMLTNTWIGAGVIPDSPAPHPNHVMALFELSPFDKDASIESLIKWGRLYRGYRDSDKNTEEAAQLATESYVPPLGGSDG